MDQIKKPPDPPDLSNLKQKSSRPDKTISSFENEYLDFHAVKQTLNSFVKKTPNSKEIISLIQRNVDTMNHITYLTYLLINCNINNM